MTAAERARDTAYTGVAKLYDSNGATRIAVRKGLGTLPPDTRAVAKGKSGSASDLAPTEALKAGLAKGAIERQAAERGLTPTQMRKPHLRSVLTTGAAFSRLTGKASGTAIAALEHPSRLPIPKDMAGVQQLMKVEARPVLPTHRPDATAPVSAQIAARDAHAAMLQGELDKHSPPLNRALATRDANQVKFGTQAVTAAVGSVAPSVKANGGPLAFIPGMHNQNPLPSYSALAHDVGRASGRAADPALLVSSLQQQKTAERLYPTVKDASDQLRPIRAEQAFEKRMNMIVEGGDRFYDAQPTAKAYDKVVAQSKNDAVQAVPNAPSAAYVSAVPSTVTDASQRLLSGTLNRGLADGNENGIR